MAPPAVSLAILQVMCVHFKKKKKILFWNQESGTSRFPSAAWRCLGKERRGGERSSVGGPGSAWRGIPAAPTPPSPGEREPDRLDPPPPSPAPPLRRRTRERPTLPRERPRFRWGCCFKPLQAALPLGRQALCEGLPEMESRRSAS